MRFIRRRQSVLIALTMALALGGWLLSGQFGDSSVIESDPGAMSTEPVAPMSVRVREFEVRPVTREVVFSARTAPAREVTLRAEAEGRVIEIPVERGARVETGEIIARLDARDREAQLAEARATVRQRQLEYDGARRLGERGMQAETQVAQAMAALEQAQAWLKRVEVELDHTAIRAPFDGVLDQRMLEIGDYVGVGDSVARLLELDPLVITGAVSQDRIGELRPGMQADARLLTGQTLNGRVRYVAAAADAATRTFTVELEVANPDAALPSGVTAEVRIPTDTVLAHYLSPSLLALDDAGALGVKTVAADGTVRFNPVAIVQASPAGVWLTGLPDMARVITVGQGFVHAGQSVRAVPEQAVAVSIDEPGDRS